MKRRKDGRFQKRVKFPDGTSKILYSTAPNEREANKEFNKRIAEYGKTMTENLKFTNVSDKWATEHFPTLQYNTLKQYKPALAQVDSFFKEYYINDIQPNDVNIFINVLVSRHYAQKTVKARLLVLNLVMKYAIINRYITINPCQYITVPKNLPKTKREAATFIEEQAIFENTDKPFGILAYFLLMTGCRRGEALALTPKDIDLKNKTVHISKTVEWLGQSPHIKNSPKTAAGIRDVPLTDNVIKLLKPLRKNKYLFCNRDGELLTNSQVTRGWNEYKKASGINATPHQLRHSYQTMLFDAGIDIKTAQRWLGHADIKTTLDIYTHLSETRLENSTKKFNEYVSALENKGKYSNRSQID